MKKKKLVNPSPISELRPIKWDKVRSQVKRVNPVLGKIIDDLNPNLPLTLGTYSYGATITSGKDSTRFPNFLVLEKSCECFWEYSDRTITQRIFKKGDLGIGYLSQRNWYNPLWKLSAGGQNVFMPTKISDYGRHKKLQDFFKFEFNQPFLFQEQRHVFNLIANSTEVQDKWECSVLFFGDQWFKKQKDPAWQPFYHYFLQEELKFNNPNTSYHQIFQLLISMLQQEKSNKFSVSQIEEVTQVFMLALNSAPGFMPLNDESLMPLKLIQLAYLEHYKLKQYEPIIMGPGMYNELCPEREAIYFSINHRNYHKFSPPENQTASNAKEFYHLLLAYEKLKDFISTKDYLHPQHEIRQLLMNCDITFYHPGTPIYDEFIPTEEIPLYDKAFAKTIERGFQFPAKSNFFNGCIQIRKIK